MRIGIDARSLGPKICGVSRVTSCLINALKEVDLENKYIIYTDRIATISGLPENFNVVLTKCNRMNPFKDYKFYKYLAKEKLDLIHVMHSWLPIFIPNRIKKVVTIYDIFTVTDPLFFEKRRPFQKIFREYFRFLTWMTISRADIIITISNYCKKEIQNTFHLKNKRIEVVNLSIGIEKYVEKIENTPLIKNKYILYLGNFRNYKNVPTLLRGYSLYIGRNINGADLVIAGNDENKKIIELAQELGIEKRIHFYHHPDDRIIDNLYCNAAALVFPSKYEGFGIPPIEAMSYGIPVIISDADALKEISGDAALVFNKYCPEDLSMKIEALLSDYCLKEYLINKGHDNIKKYSWANSAKQLKRIYDTV